MACGGDEAGGDLRTILKQNEHFFVDNLEVNKILRQLLEKSIISELEYQCINSDRNRRSQRQHIFDILISKNGDDWIQPFIQILQDTEQIHLISDTSTQLSDLDGISNISFGQTSILPEHDEIVIRFSFRITAQVDEGNMLHELSTDQAVDEAIANDVLDIREGNSICIHMRQVNAVGRTDSLEAIQKRINAVFVKTELPAHVAIDIEVYWKPRDSLFDEYFVKHKNESSSGSRDTNMCTSCLRNTILRHEVTLLDQIETDIMQETFRCSENASEFIQNVCLFVPRPRVRRARMFLIYVMQNKNVLLNFYEVCKRMDVWDFDMVSCEDCNMKGKVSSESTEKSDKEKTPFLTFTIINGIASNVQYEERIKKTEDLKAQDTLWCDEKENKQPTIPE